MLIIFYNIRVINSSSLTRNYSVSYVYYFKSTTFKFYNQSISLPATISTLKEVITMRSVLIPVFIAILSLVSIINICHLSTQLMNGSKNLYNYNDYPIQLRSNKLNILDDLVHEDDDEALVDLETLFHNHVNEDHIIQEQYIAPTANEVETGKDEISGHDNTTTNEISTPFLKNEKEQPNFIIIGVQKGGTSALGSYLSLHKELASSIRYEPHFFDFKVENIIKENNIAVERNFTYGKMTISSEGKKLILNKYWDHAFPSISTKRKRSRQNDNDSKLFFEKTPAYILRPNVPYLMQALLPWVKIIIVLRDPVERAISHYKMQYEHYTILNIKMARHNKKLFDIPSFSDCIEFEMEILEKEGIIPEQKITESRADYDVWINSKKSPVHYYNWSITKNSTDSSEQYQDSQSFPSTIPFGKLAQNWQRYYKRSRRNAVCDSLVGRGLYIFQLRNWLLAFHDTEKSFQDRFLFINNESIKPSPDHIVDLKRVTDFLHVKEMVLKEAPIIHPTHDLLEEDVFNDEIKDKLRSLYEPFNRQLHKILGDEWKNAWV